MTSDLKKCFIEFLGTFLLTFVVLCCSLLPTRADFAITCGLVLMILTYAFENISGANFNPLVTFSIFLCGKMGAKKMFLYSLFQLFGALYATMMVSLVSSAFVSQPEMQFKFWPMFWSEFIYTTTLICIYLFVVTSKKTKGNGYHGLTIGAAYTVGTSVSSNICLAALNPYILIAFLILSYSSTETFVTSIIAELCAMFVAVIIFKLLNIDNVEDVEIIGIDEFIQK